ncbi:MAG: SprT family zinc-dependent metalloprotease [Eubacteriales bacterium]|nr:SprT family zinc-dependent metalloprotease [Eubacteriales bacterium]
MDYTLIRSKRRTMALEITRDGQVLVRAPQRTSQAVIDRFVASHADWIATHQQTQQQRAENHPPLSDAEIAALRQKAWEILPDRVAHYAAIMGVAPTGVKITSAKTRFGSCSVKNRLCFSLYLMTYPDRAIDYVVVHELAHIRQKNHSPAFYAEVAKVMPDYKERVKLLKA